MFTARRKNLGIGLIEVLITTLVIALGLMAVASLQGRLMSDTRGNKVTSEARALCAGLVEDFRDKVRIGAADGSTANSYYAITEGVDMVSGYPKTVTGQNETFTVHICVENLPNTNTTKLCPVGSPNFSGTGTDPDSGGGPRKRVVTSCTWGAASASERVDVETLIGYESIRNLIAASSDGTSSVALVAPNTNAGSSDDLVSRVKVPTGSTGGTIINWGTDASQGQHVKVDPTGGYGTLFYYCDSSDITSTAATSGKLIYYEGDIFTRRVNYYPTGNYREAIELFYRDTSVATDHGGACVPKVRYNGGVILPLKGRVYTASTTRLNGTSSSPAQPVQVAASESGIFCAPIDFSGLANDTTAVNYTCYVGGNCINGPIGTIKEDSTGATPYPNYTTYNSGAGVKAAIAANVNNGGAVANAVAGENTIVTQCPTYAASGDTSYPSNVYSKIGPGGWRGKIGLLGTVFGTTGSSYDNVCFAEELAATANTVDSARNYYTRRGTGSSATNEGINKPYMCHDFLIVSGSTQYDRTCRTASGALNLASKQIVRDFSALTSTLNTVDLTFGTGSCHIIQGTVPSGVTAVGVTTGNGYFECEMTKDDRGTTDPTDDVITGYQCFGTSQASAVSVASTAGTATDPCYLTLTTGNMNPTCNLLLPGTATYTVSGNITAGTGVSFSGSNPYNPLTTLLISGPGNCSITKSGSTYSYSCTYIPGSSTVAFNAGLGFVTNPSSIAVASANVTQNIVVNAATTYTLTIVTSGTGGTTTPAPASYTYNQGSSVTITATPSAGYTFSGWSGACSGTSTTCTVTMNSNQTVTATFAPAATYNLTIITSGSGGTTNPVAGTYSYTAGTSVTITATPSTGYAFSGWSGACTGTSTTCTVTMNSSQTVTATFAPTTTYNLTIVTSGSGGTTDPAAGTYSYNAGTSVTITATPSTGYTFSGWSGACTGTSSTCTVTMNSNQTVTATFAPTATYNLTIITSGSGGTTDPVAGTYSYNAGTSVTITATPSSGYVFSGWSGACTGTSTTCTVTMNSSQTVTATFAPLTTYNLTIITSGSGGTTDPTAGTYSYIAGTSVTITATPSSGYTFSGWSGACSGTGTTCTVTMNSSQTVTATFALAATYNLTIITSGSGGTTNPAAGTYSYSVGATATITASPSSGYTFSGWSGACSGTNTTCTVTMNSSQTVTATFAPVATCNVAISGTTAAANRAVTSSLGCSVTSASNKSYTCPTVNGVADGTSVNVTSAGVTKSITVNCPTTTYPVNF